MNETIRYPVTFQSWGAFVDAAASRPGNAGPAGTMEFTETRTWDEAVELAREGWDAVIDQANTLAQYVEDKVDISRHEVGFQSYHDVSGAEVDIARFVSGEPECMIESMPIRISRQGRAVRLVVPVGFLAQVKSKAAIARGAAILALVDILAKANHPVEIWATSFAQVRERGRFFGAIKVQSADQPVDIGALSFALAHPATFRRLMFAVREQIPKLYPRSGGDSSTCELTDEAIALLPHVHGTDIRLPTLAPGQSWDADYAVAWIETQLALIFD